ncbi:MAG TPA: RHS repeat-associated core domain-containing protein [Candidatus Binataceae bacterium]|nr:RHS repeat-associated core domain-containing protein [Candidatus Binataceae bacterium]
MKFTKRSLLLIWIFLLAALLLTRGRTLAQTCNPTTLQNCVVTGGVTPAARAPAPGEAYTAQTAGLFEYSKTDLTIAAPIPIEITRTHRSFDVDANSNKIYGAFGLATTLNYDIYLYSAGEVSSGSCASASVVLPDGGQILCTNQASNTACSNYQAAVFTCNSQPTGAWFNSEITWDASVPGGGGWDLTRKDGTTYKFGAGAPLQSINDRYGNSISLTRAGVSGDSQRGNVTTITASNGRSLTLDYSGSPNNCCITGYGASGGGDAAGRKITYAYNNSEQLTTVTYPNINAQANITYTWGDGHPNVISLIAVQLSSSNKYFINLAYDFSTGNLAGLYPGNGSTNVGLKYSYKTSGGLITDVTTAFGDGSTRDLYPNSAGYIVEDVRNSSAAASKQESFIYTRNSANLITEVQESQDPLGRYTDYTYDSDGNITSVTVADLGGNSVTSSYQYDYTKFDQLDQVTNGLGYIWTIGLDSLGNPVSVTDPLSRTWSADYYSDGLIETISDPDAATNSPPYNVPLATFAYNGTDDLQSVKTRAADNETTTFGYDAVGRLLNITSPLGETASVAYDDKDDVLSATDPNGYITHYSYDWNGDITSLTDPLGNETTWAWAPSSSNGIWDVEECDPSEHCNVYTFNSTSGGVTTFQDKQLTVDTFTYDALGRLTEVDSNAEGSNPRFDKFGYDAANRMIGATHPDAGAPCTGSDGNKYTDTFNYDFLDDVTSTCTPEGSIAYGYDNIGRRTSMQPASQPAISYSWDNANELKTLATTGTSASFSYMPDGQRQALTVNNGTSTTVTTNYSYDPASERLSAISYGSTQNPSLGGLNYTYDADSRVIGKNGSLAAVNLPAASPQAAAYTNTNQIKTWTNGVSPSINGIQALTSDPLTGATYTYDQRAMLTTVSGGTSYNYDSAGRRESVTAGGATTTYLYDGGIPVQVVEGSATTNIVAVPGSNEILTIGGAVQVHDALGSVLGGISASGGFAYQYSYDSFGNFTVSGTPPSGYGNVYTLAGMEFDPDGMYHAGARYYHPGVQRFISEDPERGKANLYTYAGNNPVSGSDPSGMGCLNGDCPNPPPPIPILPDDPGADLPSPPPEDLFQIGGGGAGAGAIVQDQVSVIAQNAGVNQPFNVMAPSDAPRPCAGQKAAFVNANQAAAAQIGDELNVPAANILGLSAEETGYGTSAIATHCHNFFGIHRGASGSTGNCRGTPTGVSVSGFPASDGFLLSGQAFARQWGGDVRGVSNPSAFAKAIPPSFNPRNPALGGNPDFNSLVSSTIAGVAPCVK